MKRFAGNYFWVGWLAQVRTAVAPETRFFLCLANKRERIAWAEFVAIMKNIRPHFTDAEYVAIGRPR